MQRFILEENLNNIKTLAEQMVRKNFEYDIEKLKNEKLTENSNIKSNNLTNKKYLKKNSSNNKKSKESSSSKLNKNDLDIKYSPSNSILDKTKNKLNLSANKNNTSDLDKIKEMNTNIINTNTNLNTNINTNLNTATNLNSNLNTNANNNQNNFEGNNNGIENELYSEKNSRIYPINENSSINSSSKDINKEINEKNNKYEAKINESQNEIVKKDDNIIIEIVNPAFLKKDFDDSFDNININRKITVNNKLKKSKMRKSTLYEREKRNQKRKNEKLEKKRKQLKNEEIKLMKQYPEIDRISEQIIENKEIYIPIDKRAAKIHSLKISQRILNEENKKIKKIEEENKQLYLLKSNSKKFNQEDWDEFIERQYQWKNDVEFKKKAANVFRDNANKKYYFKPKINVRSKSIIDDIQNGNESFVDEVFIRLFNDFEEHNERQNLRNEQSLPSFKPKISKNCSQKNLFSNLKIPYKSGTTPLINFRNNKDIKKKYSLVSATGIENKTSTKAKSEKLFCDIYNDNIEKYLDKSGNKKQIGNKTQGPTQPTNNTHTNVNYSDINSDLVNSKYMILDKPLITKNKNKLLKNLSQCQIKPSSAFLPRNIRNMIENHFNEEEENNNNSSVSKNDENNKYNNYNTGGLSEKSNYEGKSILDETNFNNLDEENKKIKKNYNEIESPEIEDFYDNLNKNENQGSKKKILNINKERNLIEKINDLEKVKKYYGQSQNETINSDNSKFTENSLYKLNIRDTTPHLLKQDIVLASKDYSDFFDVPEMDDDI